MLNDADGHGGGEADEAREKLNDADALFSRLKREVKADYNSKGQINWRREAREDFDFEPGEQLNQTDKGIWQDAGRPIVIFNRVGTTVDSVAGQEVGNRQEVQFLPRRLGVAKKNELLTSAAKWFRQQCDAEDEESDAFRDLVVCNMGRKRGALGTSGRALGSREVAVGQQLTIQLIESPSDMQLRAPVL